MRLLLPLLIAACLQEAEPTSQDLVSPVTPESLLHLASRKVDFSPNYPEDKFIKVPAKITDMNLAKRTDTFDSAQLLTANTPFHDKAPLKFTSIEFYFDTKDAEYDCGLTQQKLSHAIKFSHSDESVCHEVDKYTTRTEKGIFSKVRDKEIKEKLDKIFAKCKEDVAWLTEQAYETGKFPYTFMTEETTLYNEFKKNSSKDVKIEDDFHVVYSSKNGTRVALNEKAIEYFTKNNVECTLEGDKAIDLPPFYSTFTRLDPAC